MAFTNSYKTISLLMMGETGQGKSSTANSIIGQRHVFKARGGAQSVTLKSQCEVREFDGRVIQVVDIPGVSDTRFKDDDIVINAISETLAVLPHGFTALLLILSFTSRISEKTKEAIKSLKLIFGENVLKEHTIIVFTHGDSFKNDFENDQTMTFQKWCEKDDFYRDLFKECSWRICLFDNSRNCPRDEQQIQLKELISQVDNLKYTRSNFTIDQFMAAGNTREELKRVSILFDKYTIEIGLIKDGLYKVQYEPGINKMEKIKELKEKAFIVIEDLSKEDHEKLTNIKSDIQSLSSNLQTFESLLIRQELQQNTKETN